MWKNNNKDQESFTFFNVETSFKRQKCSAQLGHYCPIIIHTFKTLQNVVVV